MRNGAIVGFRIASTLLPPVNYSDYAGENLGKIRKELGEITDLHNRIGKAAKPEKFSIKIGDNVVTQPKKDKVEKKRRKKTKGDGQTSITKAKITKPISVVGNKNKLGTVRKKVEDAKQSAVKASTKMLDRAFYPVGEESIDLSLVEAVRRRRAWTPIEDTVHDSSKLKDDECANEEIPTSGFENLVADYGYAKNEDSPVSEPEKNRDSRGEALNKRRKSEVVPANLFFPFLY